MTEPVVLTQKDGVKPPHTNAQWSNENGDLHLTDLLGGSGGGGGDYRAGGSGWWCNRTCRSWCRTAQIGHGSRISVNGGDKPTETAEVVVVLVVPFDSLEVVLKTMVTYRHAGVDLNLVVLLIMMVPVEELHSIVTEPLRLEPMI